ncbi:MAG: hypothetical protein LBI95_01110 [Holosporales bacterium]|nr:hypothetical protein [Holosporales bacterium]
MAALTSEEKDALNLTRLIFGKNAHDTKEFFESIGIQAILSYSKGAKIVIPFIGEVFVRYAGDELTDKGRVAKLETSFTPSPFLVRNIGQIQDETFTDAEKILMSRFQAVFKEKLKG